MRPPRGQGEGSSALHEERLDAVVRRLRASGASSVLDLGCGSGSLLRRLLSEPSFTRIVGVDISFEALSLAERVLQPTGALDSGRLSLRHGSYTEADGELAGFDAATLVETIEHVPPANLSGVERALFGIMRPGLVLITTPNREYNALLGGGGKRLRHRDHQFEWSRARFESWARGVASRNGYGVEFEPIGAGDAWHGSPTQMAIFNRRPGEG